MVYELEFSNEREEYVRLAKEKYLEIAKEEHPSDNVITSKLMELQVEQIYDPDHFASEAVRIVKELSLRISETCEEEVDWGGISLYGNVIKLLMKSLALGDGFNYGDNDICAIFCDVAYTVDDYWNDPEVMLIMYPELKKIIEEQL